MKLVHMKLVRPLLWLAAVVGAMAWCAAAAVADDGLSISEPDAAISTISDPNTAIRVARDHIDAHDMHGAVVELERYLMNHPEESGIQQFLGDLYVSTGDLQDAQSVYTELLSQYPLSRDLHNSLGRLYALEGKTNDAISQFEESLPNVDSIYYLVLLHARKGDLDTFTEQMRQYADDRPSDVEAQLEAAQLFGALYLPRDAALEFQRAVALDPNSVDALEGLSLSQIAEGANDNASQTLTHCLNLDPSNYGCLYALGLLGINEKDYDEAQAAFEHAHRLAPEAPEALIGMGRLADDRGEWQQAIEYYEQALYVWPYDADAFLGIAYEYEEHGLLADAKDVTLKGLNIAPDDGRLHYMLGLLYRREGNRDLALEQFIAAEQSLNPDVAQFAKESARELQQP